MSDEPVDVGIADDPDNDDVITLEVHDSYIGSE